MTNAAHTPGPWKTGPSQLEVVDQKGRMIAALGLETGAGQKEEEQLSNAQLIATAPEMLEALEYIAIDIEIGLNEPALWLKKARAAIAKAKGGAA